MMQDIDRLIAATVSDPGAGVRFRAERVARFDATAGVHFVLADFFANQARRVLRNGSWGLARAEDGLVARLGIPVRSGDPERPHISATGEALEYLKAPPGERQRPEAGAPRRRWAVEQALEWTSHE